jgi:hypothetical protein
VAAAALTTVRRLGVEEDRLVTADQTTDQYVERAGERRKFARPSRAVNRSVALRAVGGGPERADQ